MMIQITIMIGNFSLGQYPWLEEWLNVPFQGYWPSEKFPWLEEWLNVPFLFL